MRTNISLSHSIFASSIKEESMHKSCERTRGGLDKELRSGDTIRFESIAEESNKYRIVYDRSSIIIDFDDLSKLFIKSLGKSMYCSTIYSDDGEYQLYKLTSEEFKRLVWGKHYKVFIDDSVYTLIDYPAENAHEKLKEILNEDSHEVVVDSDTRFIQSRCMHFDEVNDK